MCMRVHWGARGPQRHAHPGQRGGCWKPGALVRSRGDPGSTRGAQSHPEGVRKRQGSVTEMRPCRAVREPGKGSEPGTAHCTEGAPQGGCRGGAPPPEPPAGTPLGHQKYLLALLLKTLKSLICKEKRRNSDAETRARVSQRGLPRALPARTGLLRSFWTVLDEPLCHPQHMRQLPAPPPANRGADPGATAAGWRPEEGEGRAAAWPPGRRHPEAAGATGPVPGRGSGQSTVDLRMTEPLPAEAKP